MASLNEQYTRELKDEIGYLATWLPTVPVAPGDVGRITNYEFKKLGTLEDLGIHFTSQPPQATGAFAYQSKDAVSVAIKAAGQLPPQGSVLTKAEAGITVQFQREKAIVFKAEKCQSALLDDVGRIGQEVLAKYRDGSWPEGYVVVTEVVRAESTTSLVSNGSNAKLELAATAKIDAAQLNLASADAKFATQHESNMGLTIVARGGLTPLFRASAVQKRIFRPPVFREGVEPPREEIAFTAVDYDDYAPRPDQD